MDIRCPKCGEPWDHDTLHEEVSARHSDGDTSASYDTVAAQFRSEGCGAFSAMGMRPCAPVRNQTTTTANAVYDLLGDDMDGAASTLEDAEYMGLFREDVE